MARKKQHYLKGTFTHRRTEADYMAVLLDAVSVEDWRAVITSAVKAAKAGDAGARAWLAQYLVGKPGAAAPTPLTVIVQQLSRRDPLIEKLAEPHIERMENSLMSVDDAIKDALKTQVGDELRVLEAQKSNMPEERKNTGESTKSVESTPS